MGKKKSISPVDKAVSELSSGGAGGESRKRRREKSAPAVAVGAEPSPVLWSNLRVVMERFNLTEAEATEALLAVVGPSPEGEKYIRKHCPGVLQDVAASLPSAPSAPSAPSSAASAAGPGASLDEQETQNMATQKDKDHSSEEQEEEGAFDTMKRPEEIQDGSESSEEEEPREKDDELPATQRAMWAEDGASAPNRVGMLASASGI